MLRRNLLLAAVVALLGSSATLIGQEAKPGRKVAFLVGVGDYKHETKGNQLGAPPVNDVREMKKVLETAGFEVVMLTDDDATKGRVEEAFALALNGQKKTADAKNALGNRDLLLVQLCGHGIQVEATDPDDPDQKKKLQPFFRVHDSKPNDTDTMIPFNALVRKVAENKVRTLFLVDACRANTDPNTRGRSGITARQVALPDGISILFSCAQGQEAQQDDKGLKHGVFTYAVLQTLRGQTGRTGKLRWDDLVGDVKKQFEEDEGIKAVLGGSSKRQTPVSAEGQNESVSILDIAGSPKPPKAGEERSFEIADGVKMVFCWIPAGKATLGSPKEEKDRFAKDEKEHEYESKGFWFAKYPCTQKEYEAVTGKNPSLFSAAGERKKEVKGLETDRFPVEGVSWDDSQGFLKKVNARGNGSKVFGKSGKFVLPHEDQWEYACRGGKGNGQPFFWGDSLNGDKANCKGDAVPYGTETKGRYLGRTTEVESYSKAAPHPWGLCDMAGNVYQWCDNMYDSDEKYRILRGGSWASIPCYCRAAYRRSSPPDGRFVNGIGFRVGFILD